MARGDITGLLLAVGDGDQAAFDRLYGLVYDELRRIARGQLRRAAGGATLHTTELVHEAYLKLVDSDRVAASDRVHFFALAARVMRQVLVDHFRRRSAAKRGGDEAPLALDESLVPAPDRGDDILALDEALKRLAEHDPRLAAVVECKFFGGMEHREIALTMELSERTVRRDWLKAKAWLAVAMER